MRVAPKPIFVVEVQYYMSYYLMEAVRIESIWNWLVSSSDMNFLDIDIWDKLYPDKSMLNPNLSIKISISSNSNIKILYSILTTLGGKWHSFIL